jgi:hypothetical protein
MDKDILFSMKKLKEILIDVSETHQDTIKTLIIQHYCIMSTSRSIWIDAVISLIDNMNDVELENLDIQDFTYLLGLFKECEKEKFQEELFEEVISKNEKSKYLYAKTMIL